MFRLTSCLVVLVVLLAVKRGAQAAELSINSVSMFPDAVDVLVVSGHIDNESTYAVTCLVEIIPREGNIGTLTFTPGPPADVVQLGDPWSGSGIFTPWDTHDTGSSTLNGSMVHETTMVPAPVTYSGELCSFPIVANADAAGVWDITLSTSMGDSSWEGIVTTSVAGIVHVIPEPSTLIALATGALGLLAYGWRRRRRS